MPRLFSPVTRKFASLLFSRYYFGSVIQEPSTQVRLPVRSYGGHLALSMVAEDHGNLFALFSFIFFSAALRVMDRVQQNVLPDTWCTDPMLFKATYISGLNNLALLAALIAQLSLGAWQLPLLSETHWICKACVLCSLALAVLSTFSAVNMARNLNSFDRKEDLVRWLARPGGSAKEEALFLMNFKEQFPNLSSATEDTRGAAVVHINDFIDRHEGRRASFYSCLLLTLPSTLLNLSIGFFLLAVAVYLGVVYGSRLDPAEGEIASRAVLICYTICLVLGLSLFYGGFQSKELQLKALLALSQEVEEGPHAGR
ncbi:hypothetical protein V8F06_013197 [Rhypophila decipiens]